MGRAKLEIKYREDSRARRATYMTRMNGIRKKASELSLLCGVDVLVASLSPVEFCPTNDTPEFRRIKERYVCSRMKKRDCSGGNGGNENCETSPVPVPSSFSVPSFHEEMASMENKLKEVRERLYFLQCCSENLVRQRQEAELQAQFTVSIPFQQDFYLAS